MGQIKIYGLKEHLLPIRNRVSDILHACVVDAFKYPENKRAQRFFYMDTEDFFYPEGRSEHYMIIEITLFEGRSITSKKYLYQLIFDRFEKELNISPNDIEITLTETPLYNWGIRGKPADELVLEYKISV